MKKGFIYLLSPIAIMGLWSCDSEPEPEPVVTPEPVPETTLTVSLSEIVLEEEKGSEQALTILSSEQWTLTESPEWLHVSATSGSGTSTVTIKTNSFNNSSSERTATLKISISDKECNVVVKQKAGLLANCTVTPDVYVVLADDYACNWKCDSNVSKFYAKLFKKSEVAVKSEADILVELLKEDVVSVSEIDSKVFESPTYLDTKTQYELYTVAYDKNGTQGDLVKTEFTTKSDEYQAEAFIGSISYSDDNFYWETTMGGYCSKYYMIALTGENSTSTLYNKTDVYLAFLIKSKNKSTSPLEPIIQGGEWMTSRTSSDRYINILTWGIDANGDYAGIVNRRRGYIEASTRSVKSRSLDVKATKSKGIKSETRNYTEDLKNIKVISSYK